MSIDKPAVSPAISESGFSHSSRNKRWSGGGFVSSSGGGGLNVSSELADFEDIDLGGRDPGDGDTKPRINRHHSELTGLGIRRSRSPLDTNPETSLNSSKSWKKVPPKRNSMVGLAPESPKSSGGESSRPSSKRGMTVPGALNLDSISNGNTSNMRKLSHHRRTSSELERVYDSDDSVPPETVFHNVPLSPSKIPQLPKFSKVPGPLNEDDGHPPPVPEEVATSPEEMPAQLSNTTRPASGIFPRRVVSYHEAMTALDDESKRITRELSKIPLPVSKGDDRKSDESATAVTPKVLPELARQSRRAASHTYLPSTSTLLDPLPISKEKEAVLSQTRPSWLPPKSKAEEKRHLAQYQKMVQKAEEAGIPSCLLRLISRNETTAKGDAGKRRTGSALHRQFQSMAKLHFTELGAGVIPFILNNADSSIRDSRTRALWWSGIPSARRGTIWYHFHETSLTCRAKCFDNALLITEDTYNKVIKRVSDAERSICESSPDDDTDAISNVFRRIEKDCTSVFEELKLFQHGGPMYEDLVRLTKAYAFYRSGFTYIPGAHAVAATFLLNLSPFNAFVALANSLNRYLPLAFLNGDQMEAHSLLLHSVNLRNTNITLNSTICFTII